MACSASQTLHQCLVFCVNLVLLRCAVRVTHEQTYTAGESSSCPKCPFVFGQQRHAVQAAQVTLNVCSATCARKCACTQVTASSSTACQVCCCWHHHTWHKLRIFFSQLNCQARRLCSATSSPCGMQLFNVSFGRSTPQRSLSKFNPRKAPFPCMFPVCF